MSSFSSGKLNDIKYLYENVVSGEQEVLGEAGYDAASIKAAQQASASADRSREAAASKLSNPSKGGSSDPYGVSGAAKSNPASVADKSRELALAQTRRKEDITAYKNRLGNSSATSSTPAKSSPASTDTPSRFARPQNAKPGISDVRGGQGNVTPAKTTPAASGSPAKALSNTAKTIPTAAKPAGSAMDQWAKANPNLAAASAERARIRGTQQTDNPLMKDMKSSLPMNSPSVQAPAVAKLGAGNQSLTQNPNAFKAAPTASAAPSSVGQRAAAMPSMGSSQYRATTPSAAIAAAPSASPAVSGSVVPATNKIAAMKQQPTMAPSGTLSSSYEYEDAYDVVLEYLLDMGHAETIAEAEYIMTELDEETIAEIHKGRHGQSDTEYMDSRSDAAKQISGDSKHSGASYSHRSFKGVGKPALPGERQQNQGRMTNADRNELAIRKANLKKKG